MKTVRKWIKETGIEFERLPFGFQLSIALFIALSLFWIVYNIGYIPKPTQIEIDKDLVIYDSLNVEKTNGQIKNIKGRIVGIDSNAVRDSILRANGIIERP